MRRTLIRGATTITMQPALGDLSRGDVLVEDGRITALAPSLAVEDADIVPAEGFQDRIVIPGLIATLAGALNQLNCGTTKLVDWCYNNPTPAHTDAAITALRESGIRAAFFHGSPKPDPKPGERHFSEVPHPRQEVERLLAGPLAARDGLLSLSLAILGPHYSTLDVALHDFRLARDLGLVASKHQGGGPAKSPEGWDVLEREGLVGDFVNVVHGNDLSDARMALAHQRALDNAASRVAGNGIPPATTIPAREALSWITVQGARMLRIQDRIGTLGRGCRQIWC